MSESDVQPEGQVDNWVFDSLVNFLHGSIWKVPVVGFIEEKSVVFDPDSYNNMTEEKEEEFRKIHEEYKAVVDFMLSSFMEDLQVTPEQVEDACRVREHQSKSLPESHITKVALEQLWAAEDFTAFRRLMTRKNIDLQLQSLELLVAKYGVLSPSLRSGDSEEPAGDDGEDDFLQVVIRYSDQLELFKCDYGTDGSACPGRESCTKSAANGDTLYQKTMNTVGNDEKNMKVHLSGIQFKNNVAPTPVKYQATLMSSSTSFASNEIISPSPEEIHTQDNQEALSNSPQSKNAEDNPNNNDPEANVQLDHINSDQTEPKYYDEPSQSQLEDNDNTDGVEEETNSNVPDECVSIPSPSSTVSVPEIPLTHPSAPSPSPPSPSPPSPSPPSPSPPSPSPPSPPVSIEENENILEQICPDEPSNVEAENILDDTKIETETERHSLTVSPPPIDTSTEETENVLGESDPDQPSVIIEADYKHDDGKSNEAESESQLIQLEEAEAAMEESIQNYADFPKTEENEDDASGDAEKTPTDERKELPCKQSLTLSPRLDEKTAAEIAITAPEQRRLLTAVRKALEINPDESEPLASIDIPSSFENDEDLQKRREYLRAQRDKLIAMKKQEREKLLLENSSAGGSQPSRPKSARAAQIAIKNPLNMRAATIGEKSLSARRALADRLKQELIDKQ